MVRRHQVSARLDGHLDKALAVIDEDALLLLRRAMEDAGHALRRASRVQSCAFALVGILRSCCCVAQHKLPAMPCR